MKHELKQIEVKEINAGFVYSKSEEKGLFGMNGKLTIQPRYQRNYVYGDGKRDVAVIETVLKQNPLNLITFFKRGDSYEIMDGQQRIVSICRFIANQFPVQYNGHEYFFDTMEQEQKEIILNTKLSVNVCEGETNEMREHFETLNIAGVPLTKQELRNNTYMGDFVDNAKVYFSNHNNRKLTIWKKYIKGDVRRQEIFELALEWVSGGEIERYMAEHRNDTDINEIQAYFDDVIEWVETTFPYQRKEMCGLKWGELYAMYGKQSYNVNELQDRVSALYNDDNVDNKKGIFEFVLGGEIETKLLNVRLFDDRTKKQAYNKQTQIATANGHSNCPLCAIGSNSNKTKIWELKDMDADHVTAWSNGGETSIENCEMLCKSHNRAKGNK